MCLPYDDCMAITSVVLSITSVVVSWIWWVSFIISFIGLVLSQLSWCLRLPKYTLYAFVAVAGVSSLAQIAVGIFVLIKWRKKEYCYIFVFDDDEFMYNNHDDDIYYYDACSEEVWASIAFISAALWAASAGFMFYFVNSGRHAKWEEKHGQNTEIATSTPIAIVELASTSAPAYAQGITAESAQPEPQLSSAGGDPAIATGVVPLSESDKVDSTN